MPDDGMSGIWELLRTLFDEADKAFSNAVLASFTTMSSCQTTRIVISKVSRNAKFQTLYKKINQSPAAAYLIQHVSPHVPEDFGEDITYPLPSAGSFSSAIDDWNFLISTIKFNPLIKIFRNEVLNYVCPPSIILLKFIRIYFGTDIRLNTKPTIR